MCSLESFKGVTRKRSRGARKRGFGQTRGRAKNRNSAGDGESRYWERLRNDWLRSLVAREYWNPPIGLLSGDQKKALQERNHRQQPLSTCAWMSAENDYLELRR